MLYYPRFKIHHLGLIRYDPELLCLSMNGAKSVNQRVLEKLTTFLDESENISDESSYLRWFRRVRTFMSEALGQDDANRLDALSQDTYWYQRLPKVQGHLDGLITKAQAAEMDSTATQNSNSTAAIPSSAPSSDGRKVFIVHGHDNAAKDSTARFLDRLGLEPIVLHEQASSGRAVIEKFEVYSGDVVFAVVLLTPDDVGAVDTEPHDLKKRARQNVIMELGYFLGRLGRTRVCALCKGDIELPSDYQGVLYIDMDPAGAWKGKLAQELVQSKVTIQLEGLLGA
jgi:predicted nucleotide-binding protein